MVTTETDSGGTGVPGAGFVYVSDFGIVGPLSGSQASSGTAGATVGSLEHKAAEWLLHGHGDHRVDIYAMGCVLYEAMTARKPFPRERLTAMIQDHLNTTPPRASQYIAAVPGALDQVIATAMAKEPAHRYPSAGDLAAAARAALDRPDAGRAAASGMPSSPDIIDPPTVPGLRLRPPPASTMPPDPVPPIVLCHILSGGLPRDVLRFAHKNYLQPATSRQTTRSMTSSDEELSLKIRTTAALYRIGGDEPTDAFRTVRTCRRGHRGMGGL